MSTPLPFSDEERHHLDLMQGVINRLAGNQFLIKGWALTVAAAILGYAAAHHYWAVALLGAAVAVGFWGLDAYFLRQERLFRRIWVAATRRPSSVPAYSLDTGPYRAAVPYFRRRPDENGRKRAGAALAGSVAGLHGMILAVSLIMLVTTAVAAANRSHQSPHPRSTTATNRGR